MIRIVKMTFRPDSTKDFLKIFNAYSDEIRNQPGCKSLKLVQDLENPVIFFTISEWDDPSYLEQYRNNELFKTVWSSTKVLFGAKPEAWSVGILSDI